VLLIQSRDYLIISEAAAAAFAAARLLQYRVAGRFRFLCTYLIATSLSCAVLSVLARGSRTYFWIFIASESLLCFVAVLAVQEMFALLFRAYPGLRTLGGWALSAALFVSLLIFLIFFRPPWEHESPNTRILFYELALDRLVHFALAVVIMMQMYFLSHYPLRLDRTTKVASAFFSAMFLAQSAARLLDTLTPKLFVNGVDYSEVVFSALCFIGWGLMLQPDSVPAPRPSATQKPREAELLQQLESLNDMLSRSGRR
jgi:hypothetical protein